MKEKILSPTYPESVEEGVIASWKKLEGELIIQDEVLAEIETDKVVIEVVAANDGVMTRIIKAEGEVVNSCLLYTSPSPRDGLLSRMPSSA